MSDSDPLSDHGIVCLWLCVCPHLSAQVELTSRWDSSWKRRDCELLPSPFSSPNLPQCHTASLRGLCTLDSSGWQPRNLQPGHTRTHSRSHGPCSYSCQLQELLGDWNIPALSHSPKFQAGVAQTFHRALSSCWARRSPHPGGSCLAAFVQEVKPEAEAEAHRWGGRLFEGALRLHTPSCLCMYAREGPHVSIQGESPVCPGAREQPHTQRRVSLDT